MAHLAHYEANIYEIYRRNIDIIEAAHRSAHQSRRTNLDGDSYNRFKGSLIY